MAQEDSKLKKFRELAAKDIAEAQKRIAAMTPEERRHLEAIRRNLRRKFNNLPPEENPSAQQ